ncbi:MAG: HAD-IA family hydrolase [Planctomycetes bacterium]|nr:HAD-IA family hydrolase [Planctomycetota bacterium]
MGAHRGGQYTGGVLAPAPFLFDLDGTLADTLPDIAASCNHVRARFGLPPCLTATVRGFVGDGARTLLARALHGALPTDADAAARALDDAFAGYVAHHATQCTVHARLYPGALRALQALHEGGHPLAVVTNKPTRFTAPILRALGLERLLPVVVGGDTLPQRKPDAAPIRHALAQLGAGPRGATMVGDGVQDVRAGKAAGVRTIACLYGYGDPAALRAEGADGYWSAFGALVD